MRSVRWYEGSGDEKTDGNVYVNHVLKSAYYKVKNR